MGLCCVLNEERRLPNTGDTGMNRLATYILLMLSLTTASRAAEGDKPNVLIIMTDQQFAEVMSCAQGTKYLHTPNMDSIAANGMRFNRAYAANPLCCPSRTSSFTGRYPHETGVQGNSQAFDVERFPMLGKAFKDAGYDTGYTGKTHIRFSINPSGHTFTEKTVDIHGFDYLYQENPNRGDSPRRGDFGRVAPGVEFLKMKRDKPFLLVVSCMNPHDVCEYARNERLPNGDVGTPPPLEQLPPLPENHLPPQGETEIISYMRWATQRTSFTKANTFDEKKWRELIWAYYRMTEMADAEIGRVLTALRETGQEENTIIVFLSDHGDGHGSHKWNQKQMLYDESARVPFIISWKGKTRQGTSDLLVNTGVDLFPTLCDFAGIEPPNGLPGKSLMKPSLGVVPSWKREYVVSETHIQNAGGVGGVTKEERGVMRIRAYGRMVRSDRFKYCVYSESIPAQPIAIANASSEAHKRYELNRQLLKTVRQESLIDMENDPGEMKNLAKDPAYKEVLLRHREYLEEFCQEHGDTFSAPRSQ
jgi:arylsulfatase A-like enzyme